MYLYGRLRRVRVAHRAIPRKDSGLNPGGDRQTYIYWEGRGEMWKCLAQTDYTRSLKPSGPTTEVSSW